MRTDELLYFSSDEFKQNLKKYEQMFDKREDVYMDASELIDIAEYYTLYGTPEQVADCVAYALKLHPRATDPLAFKARQLLLADDLEGARKLCDLIENQQEEEFFYLNAELLIKEKKIEEATRYLTHQLKMGWVDDNSYPYEVAELFADYQEHEEALRWLEIALINNPHDKSCLELKFGLLIQEKRYDEVIPLLENHLNDNPYEKEIWGVLAEIYMVREEFDKAIDACDFALAIDAQLHDARITKANCFYNIENYEMAHQLYQEVEKEQPLEAMCYMFDGVALTNLEHYEEAVLQFENGEQLADGDDERRQIYIQKAFALSKLHRLNEAIESIDKAIEITPDDCELYTVKGHVLLENDENENAIEVFKQAIRIASDVTKTEFQIAISLFDNQYYLRCIDMLKEIEKKNESEWNDKLPAYLAVCYMHINETVLFLHYLQRACQMNPEQAKDILGQYFPNLQPCDYYSYSINQLKSEQ